MQFILDETRKHCSFREVWVGYLLGAIFLLISIFQDIQFETRWFIIQQDIYAYGATLTAFLIAIGLSRLFCYEQERGTAGLIKTTKIGTFQVWKEKFIFSVVYCAIVVFLIGGLSLLIKGTQFGFENALSPVSESVYFHSIPLSNLAYCIIQYLLLFLGALYFAGFVVIVATITKRTALTIFLTGGTFIAFTGYYYVGRFWVQGNVLSKVLDFFFRFGFNGFMLQESYSWTSIIGISGDWPQVWKPILFVISMIAIEFTILWLLWRRKERK